MRNKEFITENGRLDNGFTLIELLLVISIVALLSSTLFYNMTEARKKAQDSHMKVEAAEVEKAIGLYRLDNNGQVPTSPSVRGIMVQEQKNGGGNYASVMEQLVPNYLPEVPTSPSGESYAYMTNDEGTEAVFAVSLNFSGSNSSGSNNNSCEMTSMIVNYEEWVDYCTYYFPNYTVIDTGNRSDPNDTYLLTSNPSWSCSGVGNAPAYAINCSFQGGNYPIACSSGNTIKQDVYNATCYGSNEDIDHRRYSCSVPIESDSICSGGSNNDYCTCI